MRKTSKKKQNVLINLTLFITIVFSFSCKEDTLLNRENSLDSNILSAEAFVNDEITQYTEKKVQILVDSLDNLSGFIGWRNIRDYVGLGDENMKSKVNRIWDGIYHQDEINIIANKHIQGLLSGTQITADYSINIKKTNYIENYAHKVGLSGFFLVIELIIEGFISYWIAFAIGFAVAFIIGSIFSTPIGGGVLVIIIAAIALVVCFLIFSISDAYSQASLCNHIVDEITNNNMIPIREQFDLINQNFILLKK